MNLPICQVGEFLSLNFPVDQIESALPPDQLVKGVGKQPLEIWKGKTDYLLKEVVF